MDTKINLLTDDERIELPAVLLRRTRFKNIIMKCIRYKEDTFSNGILIIGKPGSGKTTLVTEFLDELLENGEITDFKRASGHITQTSLFEYMKTLNPKETVVHLLDDVDCLWNPGCLEILKAALDTKGPNKDNRVVSYYTKGVANSYKYFGFCIIISNDAFVNPTEHQRALLDRVHLMEIDLEYHDFMIFNTHLIETYLNDNPDELSDDIRQCVADFYNDIIRKWFEGKAFQKANINFSVRLIKKFIDLIVMFGNEWKGYSIDYKRLNSVI